VYKQNVATSAENKRSPIVNTGMMHLYNTTHIALIYTHLLYTNHCIFYTIGNIINVSSISGKLPVRSFSASVYSYCCRFFKLILVYCIQTKEIIFPWMYCNEKGSMRYETGRHIRFCLLQVPESFSYTVSKAAVDKITKSAAGSMYSSTAHKFFFVKLTIKY